MGSQGVALVSTVGTPKPRGTKLGPDWLAMKKRQPPQMNMSIQLSPISRRTSLVAKSITLSRGGSGFMVASPMRTTQPPRRAIRSMAGK